MTTLHWQVILVLKCIGFGWTRYGSNEDVLVCGMHTAAVSLHANSNTALDKPEKTSPWQSWDKYRHSSCTGQLCCKACKVFGAVESPEKNCNRAHLIVSLNQSELKSMSGKVDSPVGDFCREFEAPEGGQKSGHALLKALWLPRVPSRRHYGHIHVGAHQ